MAYDIGPKIGLDGEAEFRSQINGINQSLRTLGTEMKMVSSSFAQNGQSQSALTAKNKVLEKQMDQLKVKINESNKALSKAKEKFGENSNEAQKWQQVINTATTKLNGLESELSQNSQALNEMSQGLRNSETGMMIAANGTELFKKKLDGIKKKAEQVRDSLNGIASKFAPLSLAIGGAGIAAIKFGSDTSEANNKVEVSFGKSDKSVKNFAKTSLRTFGIAKGDALDMAALFGDMGTSMGIPQEQMAKMSTSLVGLGGDLSSFKNIGIDEATTALNGVFTGETESLKRIGIVMTQTNLDAFALANGFGKTTAKMTESEKVNLRYAYVLDKTKNAHGDYARTADGTANSVRTLQGSIKELASEIGNNLSPIITPVIQKFTAMVQKFGEMDNGTQKVIIAIAAMVAMIAPIAKIGAVIAGMVGTITTAIGVVTEGLAIFAGAVASGGAAATIFASVLTLLTGPIGIVIAAIAGLVAVFALLWNKCDGFKEAVTGLFSSFLTQAQTILASISAQIQEFVGFIQPYLSVFIEMIKGIFGIGLSFISMTFTQAFTTIKAVVLNAMAIIQGIITGVMGVIQSVIGGAMQVVQGIVKTVTSIMSGDWKGAAEGIKDIATGMASAVVGTLQSLQSSISGIFNNLVGNFKEWGSDMISGLISGIEGMIGNVGDAAKGVADKIKSLLHFSRPDEGPLRDYETWMPDFMQGLANGIKGNMWMVTDSMKRLTKNMQSEFNPNSSIMVSAMNSISAKVDYEKIAKMNQQGIYIDGRLIGRSMRELGVVFA